MKPHSTTSAAAGVTWSRMTTAADMFWIALLFMAIGLWYAGPIFLQHFFDGIPAGVGGNIVGHMAPGDQYEAYYRHTLPFYNFERGKPLLYSGYQYALSQRQVFVDGMIYLPFATLVSLLALAIGPIAAFNAMAILSFALCGMFGYLLGREVSGSRLAGLIAAAIISLLPFRVGFLFGEMFYATDMALLPLALFLFIRLLRAGSWWYAGSFASVILLLATANFAMLYWTLLLFGPSFLVGTLYVVRLTWPDWRKLCGMAAAAALPLLLTALYVFHVKGVLHASGLASGQKWDQLRLYSPEFANLFTRWNGIEKTVYSGLAGLFAAGGIIHIAWMRKHRSDAVIYYAAIYAAGLFVVSYALAFGLSFDSATGIPLYEALFKYVPFANASRTPGRLMPIVGVCAAVLSALFASAMFARIRGKRGRLLLAVLLTLLIAVDYKFSAVSMTTLETDNQSYAAIKGASESALGIPFRREADNYAGTTFQYFALTNDLRMINGHSSTFPSDWAEFYSGARPLNYGEASSSFLADLRRRGVRYLLAHNTAYEPKVSISVIAMLNANPALRRLREDSGVVLYEIVDPALAPEHFDSQNYVDAIRHNASLTSGGSEAVPPPGVEEMFGWYSREAYAGKTPFRWMAGTTSLILATPGSSDHPNRVIFSYRCPYGELSITGIEIQAATQGASEDGWHKIAVTIPRDVTSVITLTAPLLYTVPTDERKFGCMVSDFLME